jgi:dTMP kinase
MSRFICIEGLDGVGKTKITRLVADRLGYQYYKCPGAKFAAIRHVMDEHTDPLTRYFFYRAANQEDSRAIAQLLRTVPGVVCDRYIYSTIATHAALDERVWSLSECTGLIIPDYVYLLTTRQEVRLARLQRRAHTHKQDFDLVFQRRVEANFRSFGHPIIDNSDLAVEETVNIILASITARWKQSLVEYT